MVNDNSESRETLGELSSGALGLIVIVSSFSVAFVLCTGICLALWCRKVRGNPSELSPANLIVQRQPRSLKSSNHAPPTMTLLLPTVSYSEAGSEPCTPASTLTSTDRLSGRSRLSTPSFSPVDSPLSEKYSTPFWKFLPPSYLASNIAGIREISGPNVDENDGVPPGTVLARSAPSSSYIQFPPDVKGRNDIRSWPQLAEIRGFDMQLSSTSCGLGEVRLRVIYRHKLQQLCVIILSAHQLPSRFNNPHDNLYSKMILSIGDRRIRFISPLVPASSSPSFCATFRHTSSIVDLSSASITLSVCQEEHGGRRVVAGSAALELSMIGFKEEVSRDVDSGHLILPLRDSSPQQQVACGGELRLGIGWEKLKHSLNLSNMIISKFNLEHLYLKDHTNEHELPWVYLKVCVYMKESLVCWKRTRPVPLYPDITPLEDNVQLYLPKAQLINLNLALSIRQKTRQRGGRRVLGGVTIGNLADTPSGRQHWRSVLEGTPAVIVHSHSLAHP